MIGSIFIKETIVTKEMKKAIRELETSTGIDLLWKDEITDGDSFCDVVRRNKNHRTDGIEEDFRSIEHLGSKVMN